MPSGISFAASPLGCPHASAVLSPDAAVPAGVEQRYQKSYSAASSFVASLASAVCVDAYACDFSLTAVSATFSSGPRLLAGISMKRPCSPAIAQQLQTEMLSRLSPSTTHIVFMFAASFVALAMQDSGSSQTSGILRRSTR